MKIISKIIIVIILIVIVWFSWNKLIKKDDVMETSEEVLDKSTQADTTDDINSKLNDINIDVNSSEDFESIDAEINSI